MEAAEGPTKTAPLTRDGDHATRFRTKDWPRREDPRHGRGLALVIAALAVGVTVLMLVPTGSPLLGSPASYSADPSAAGVMGDSSPTFPTPIHHVMVIFLENEPASTVLADGPYERKLAETYAYANHFYAVAHPSAPNYLSATAGSPFNSTGSDGRQLYNTLQVGDLVNQAGMTWSEYAEGMPVPCYTQNTGLYVVRHVPFLWYTDVADNESRCDADVVNFNAFNASLASGTMPNYMFITPNDDHNGHNTGISGADSWLASWLPNIMNQSWFSSTAIFITYDESKTSDTSGYNGTAGGNVYLAVVSPYACMGCSSQRDYSDYNILTTTEWLLGLGTTGNNDSNWAKWPPMKDLFDFSNPVAQAYPVDGRVTSSNGTPLAAATVVCSKAPNGSSRTVETAANGTFSFDLTNGTYELSVSAAGFLSNSTHFTVSGAAVSGVSVVLNPTKAAIFPVDGWVNSTSGAGVSAATVSFDSAATGNFSTLTDLNGSFQTELANATYAVTASAPGYFSFATQLSVAGQPVSGLDLELTPVPTARYPVSGEVVTSTSGLGYPGASVEVQGPDGIGSTTSNASGGFSFTLTNGTYVLSANVSGFAPAAQEFTVDGAPVGGVLLELYNATPYLLAGTTIETPQGSPMSGVTIFVNGSGTSQNTSSGVGGYFVFFVGNGTYTVQASLPFILVEVNVTVVVDGSNITDLAIDMPAVPLALFSVSGFVTAANGGGPVGGADVQVNYEGTLISGETSANGSYVLYAPNSTYQVTIVLGTQSIQAGTLSVEGHGLSGIDFLVPRSMDPAEPPDVNGQAVDGVPLATLALSVVFVAALAIGVYILRRSRRY